MILFYCQGSGSGKDPDLQPWFQVFVCKAKYTTNIRENTLANFRLVALPSVEKCIRCVALRKPLKNRDRLMKVIYILSPLSSNDDKND